MPGDAKPAPIIEDTAVVASNVAIITNPGADSRKGEEDTIAAALSKYRKLEKIQPPGTVDGGDICSHSSASMSKYIVEDDNTVVDHHTDSDSEAGQGNHIKCVATQIH